MNNRYCQLAALLAELLVIFACKLRRYDSTCPAYMLLQATAITIGTADCVQDISHS